MLWELPNLSLIHFNRLDLHYLSVSVHQEVIRAEFKHHQTPEQL